MTHDGYLSNHSIALLLFMTYVKKAKIYFLEIYSTSYITTKYFYTHSFYACALYELSFCHKMPYCFIYMTICYVLLGMAAEYIWRIVRVLWIIVIDLEPSKFCPYSSHSPDSQIHSIDMTIINIHRLCLTFFSEQLIACLTYIDSWYFS